MPRRQHHRVIGFLGALTENLFRDGDSVGREVDVIQVIFPDPVGAHHEEVTGADRNRLCRADFRDPVADDARGETGTGPDMDAAGCLGHQIGGDVADPRPRQRVRGEIHPHQRHRDPSGSCEQPVAKLDQDFEPLGTVVLDRIDRAQCSLRGGRPVAEAIHQTEQRGLAADVD